MSVVAPELALLPDAERIVSEFLRGDARMDAIVSDRIYTTFPANAGMDPLVLIQRIGGVVPLSIPLVLDGVDLQIDCYGGPKRTAERLAQTMRATLTELEGTIHPGEGIVSAVRFGAMRWLPDETYSPPRARYVADVTVHVRAAVVPAAG